MSEFTKVWNGKPAGVPAAMVEVLCVVGRRVFKYIYSYIWSRNVARCGGNLRIHPSVVMRNPSAISFGENISIDSGSIISTEFMDSVVSIGDDTHIGQDVLLDFSGDLVIGKNVVISAGVISQTHDHGYYPKSRPSKKSLIIANGVWLATRAVVLAGVNRIGENSIVAAGSVVTREVADNVIVAGNPAKVIANRVEGVGIENINI